MGKKMCTMAKKLAAKDAKDRCKCEQSTNLGTPRPHDRLIAKAGYRNLLDGEGLTSGLTSGFLTITMSACMMHDALRVHMFLLKKSTIKMDHPPCSPDLDPCNF
jgi:hypothetical protein